MPHKSALRNKEEFPVRCPHCSITARDEEQLQKHISLRHNDRRGQMVPPLYIPLICVNCFHQKLNEVGDLAALEQSIRNAVLDEVEKRVGDPWSLERGEWDRIMRELRDAT